MKKLNFVTRFPCWDNTFGCFPANENLFLSQINFIVVIYTKLTKLFD